MSDSGYRSDWFADGTPANFMREFEIGRRQEIGLDVSTLRNDFTAFATTLALDSRDQHTSSIYHMFMAARGSEGDFIDQIVKLKQTVGNDPASIFQALTR